MSCVSTTEIDWPITTGSLATIPAKIKNEIPFEIPYSVINSPSHTASIVPAVIEAIRATRSSVDRFEIIP